MRPCTSDGLPVMGAIPGVTGAYISTGYDCFTLYGTIIMKYSFNVTIIRHNCWGILWAPISGKCMADLIIDGGSVSVDLSPFSPDRFGGNLTTAKRKRGKKASVLQTAVGEQW